MDYYIIKADRAGLVAKRVPVKGKTKVYQAIRYIAPEETKKRVKEFVKERERQSKHTRYMKKNPGNVDVITQAELKKHIEANEKGNRYFYGVNVEQIDKAVMILDPKQAEGLVGMIIKNDGTKPVMKYSDEQLEKKAKKKHIRSKRLGNEVGELRTEYQKNMAGKSKKQQIAACIALMDIHEVRVGGHAGSEDHFGSTTLQGQHVVKINTQADADRLAKKMFEDRIAPVVKMESEAQTEADSVVREKKLQRAGKKREEVMAKIESLGKPKVGEMWVDFLGKSGVWWSLNIQDPLLKTTITKLSEGKKSGEEIFPLADRANVAKTLKKYKVIPKDFRSYHGTKDFADAAEGAMAQSPKNLKEVKGIMKSLFQMVSANLRNTPGMAKKAYVDPAVAAHVEAKLLEKMEAAKRVNKSVKLVINELVDIYYR